MAKSFSSYATYYSFPKELVFDKLDEEALNFVAIEQHRQSKKLAVVKLMHLIGALQ